MHVAVDGEARALLRRLEERADVDVEAEVGESRGDDLRAPIVAILAELYDEQAGATSLAGEERLDAGADGGA
jgi:hypothetical protein